jgi:hypothetical protein
MDYGGREENMDWAGLAMGLAGSAASGGILGLFGSLIGGGLKFLQTRQQQKFEKEKWTHELALLELEMKRSVAEDEHELALISQQGAWKGVETSLNADAALASSDTYRWSKAVKELYRPFLTSALFIMVWLIFADLMDIFRGSESVLATAFSKAEAKSLLTYIVQSVVFTATTAGVWWFGDRAFAPPGLKNR